GRVQGDQGLRQDYERVLAAASSWLDDYALFAALKDRHDGASWWTWEAALAHREPGALAEARRELADGIAAHRFFQYLFLRQWLDLKGHANAQGVKVIGDVPMFVALDSPTCGRVRISGSSTRRASRRWWPACRRMRSAPPASAGATRSTTGPASARK